MVADQNSLRSSLRYLLDTTLQRYFELRGLGQGMSCEEISETQVDPAVPKIGKILENTCARNEGDFCLVN